MAKPNYSFEKRQRELAKKKKKEEKEREKAGRKTGSSGDPGTEGGGSEADAAPGREAAVAAEPAAP